MRALALIVCLLGALEGTAVAGDLLRDPDKASSWQQDVTGMAAMTMRLDQGAFRFDVTRIDKEDWRAEAYQVLTGLHSNTPYTLRFSAKASSPRELHIWSQFQGGSWGSANAWFRPPQLTTQWQEFVVPFTFKEVEGKQIRAPIFALGNATGTYWIKDISLSDNSPAQPAAPSVPPAAAQAAPRQSPAELLHNPLELTTWTLQQHSGAKASLSRTDEDLKLVVENPGSAGWHIELFAVSKELKAPGTYTLSVAMRADAPRKISFEVLPNTSPYTPIVPVTDISIDTQLKLYKIEFQIASVPGGEVRLPQFMFGGSSTGTVWLRPMSLTGPVRK